MATTPGSSLNSKQGSGQSSFNILSFLQGVGFPLAGTLLDNETVGSFCAVLKRTITAANTDTVIDHALGRKPQGYHVIRRNVAGIFYDGSSGGADWTDRTITIRSTVAPITFSLLLF